VRQAGCCGVGCTPGARWVGALARALRMFRSITRPTHAAAATAAAMVHPIEALDAVAHGCHYAACNTHIPGTYRIVRTIPSSCNTTLPQLPTCRYSVVVRCALGGQQAAAVATAGAPAAAATSAGSCFRNLRHEFLYVSRVSSSSIPPQHDHDELLVDPCFREQFAIPQPTAAFRTLLSAVPDVFVGTVLRLQPVVDLLCAEVRCAALCSLLS
jgi:uncharacterized protein (TIGR01615 family)